MVNKHFGEGSVTRGALQLIKNSASPIDVVDGVRWESDFVGIRSLESLEIQPFMIYVSARPEIRFKRLKARRQRKGEDGLTWEQFLEQDNALNEIFVEGLGARADIEIFNDGDLEYLKKQ